MNSVRSRWLFVLLVVGGVILVIALATWVLTSTGGAKNQPGAALPTIAATPSSTPTASATPHRAARRSAAPSTASGVKSGGKPAWGWGYSDTPHQLVLRVTTGQPVFAYLGWRAPTSHPTGGKATMYATSWTRSFTVYGSPYFVTFYVQFGPSKGPVSCSVTVDGRVLVTKTADGPFGGVMCIG